MTSVVLRVRSGRVSAAEDTRICCYVILYSNQSQVHVEFCESMAVTRDVSMVEAHCESMAVTRDVSMAETHCESMAVTQDVAVNRYIELSLERLSVH